MGVGSNVESIRAWRTERGQDVSGMSDVDLLLQELDEANAEAAGLRRRDEDRRSESLVRERATRTSARRYYEDRVAAWDRMVFHSLSRLSGETVRAALYRAANLTGAASVDDVADMREAAEEALHLWKREMWDLADGAGRHESVSVATQQRQEIARLRKLITGHAVSLSDHNRGRGPGQVCVCAGCELIRAMDDVEEPSAASAARS